jgi:hypothetical protein
VFKFDFGEVVEFPPKPFDRFHVTIDCLDHFLGDLEGLTFYGPLLTKERLGGAADQQTGLRDCVSQCPLPGVRIAGVFFLGEMQGIRTG